MLHFWGAQKFFQDLFAFSMGGAALIDWLCEQSDAFREAVEYLATAPAAVYANAIRASGLPPNATIVVDHFPLVELANEALTKVRRRAT
jgi:transposase